MSLGRAALGSLRCMNCQRSIVATFASLPKSSSSLVHPARQTVRQITSTARLHHPRSNKDRRRGLEAVDFEPLVEGINNVPAEHTKTTPNTNTASSTQPTPPFSESSQSPPTSQSTTPPAAVPWYLQTTAPPPSDSPVSSRNQLPDLPAYPPPLLATLLEHISTDLGLDDLALLDLRHLNPPAALGSNLIMVVGSARSEKHLHVSADRFCRYLRKEHRLKPYAAGLLGRNELKIKLRRKAKRAKIMAAAGGAADAGALDDGIRTGWVCVTVGRVPEAEGAPREVREEVVGFNEEVGGCTVVVQMFEEGKRAATDLEGLWGAISRKHAREQGKVVEIGGDEEVDEAAMAELGNGISAKAEKQELSAGGL